MDKVYIIFNARTNLTKIGVSNDVDKRLTSLQSSTGCYLKLIYATQNINNAYEVEKIMHILYKNNRQLGEWFLIDYKSAKIRLKDIYLNVGNCNIIKAFNKGKTIYDIGYRYNLSKSNIIDYLSFYKLYKH